MPTESESNLIKQNTTDVKRSSWLSGIFNSFSRQNETVQEPGLSLSQQISQSEGDTRKLSDSEDATLKNFLKQRSIGEGSSHSDCESLSEDLDTISSSPINGKPGGLRRNKTFPYLSQFTFHDNELAENDNLGELQSKSNLNANRNKDKIERSSSFDASNPPTGFRRRFPSESSLLGSLTGRGALFPDSSFPDQQNEEAAETFDTSEIIHFLSSGRSY